MLEASNSKEVVYYENKINELLDNILKWYRLLLKAVFVKNVAFYKFNECIV